MAALITILVRLLFAGMLTIAFSCGGGGVSVMTVNTGSLALTITGLPAGTSAAVVVTGPNNLRRSVTASETIADLTAGAYTISSASVLAGSTTFNPQIATQTVSVSAGATATASVAYTTGLTLKLGLVQVATGFTSPVFLTTRPGDTALFIVDQPGTISIVRNGTTTKFLDITTTVSYSTGGEQGLLSMAFDPNYAANGFFYIYYTDASGNIAIDRYTKSATNADLADPASILHIINIPHPTNTNHNGGLLTFGADGFLYAGTGDGGGGGDPPNNAQNLNVLLGKLLRIDVNNRSGVMNYAIPTGNPFFNQANRRGEIWAYGLRNPWRYAFDPATNQLYIADVGQDVEEEVDVAPGASGGLNYGWNITEGDLCFLPSTNCNKAGLTPPVFKYDHAPTGGCAIIGGYVYRGSAISELAGRYFYSDTCAGWLRSFRLAGGQVTEQVDWANPVPGSVLSFGQDAASELYLLYAGGIVYRVIKQ